MRPMGRLRFFFGSSSLTGKKTIEVMQLGEKWGISGEKNFTVLSVKMFVELGNHDITFAAEICSRINMYAKNK